MRIDDLFLQLRTSSPASPSVGALLPCSADRRSPWRTSRFPDVQILTGIVGLQLRMNRLRLAALIGVLAVSVQKSLLLATVTSPAIPPDIDMLAALHSTGGKLDNAVTSVNKGSAIRAFMVCRQGAF